MKHNTGNLTYESPIVAFNSESEADAHFLDYVHGLVPISRTRDVAATQISDVVAAVTTTSNPAAAFDRSRSATTLERPPLPFGIDLDPRDHHRSLSFILSAMEKRFGIRTRFLDGSEAPPAASTATTSRSEAPSLTSFDTLTELTTLPRPFFDGVSDINIPAFTTACRPASLTPTALSIAPIESMQFEQIPKPALQPPISQSTGQQLTPERTTTTPLWPLWILLLLISVLTLFAVLVYYKLILRPALRRRNHGTAEISPVFLRREHLPTHSMPRANHPVPSGQPLPLRTVPYNWETDDTCSGYALHGKFSDSQYDTLRSCSIDPATRDVPKHTGVVVSDRNATASSVSVVHHRGAAASLGVRGYMGSHRPVSQHGEMADHSGQQHMPSLGYGLRGPVTVPASVRPQLDASVGGLWREQALHHDLGMPAQVAAASPAYASGTSLTSPYPRSPQTPLPRNPSTDQLSMDNGNANHDHLSEISGSQVRQRRNQLPRLHVDTTLANDSYGTKYIQNIDLESQIDAAPVTVDACFRSWLSLPKLNHSHHTNNSTSSSASRTHSRSSSTSSLLSNIVNGVAEKIVSFTNDTSGPEHGLLLPISARDRQEADEMGGEV